MGKVAPSGQMQLKRFGGTTCKLFGEVISKTGGERHKHIVVMRVPGDRTGQQVASQPVVSFDRFASSFFGPIFKLELEEAGLDQRRNFYLPPRKGTTEPLQRCQ